MSTRFNPVRTASVDDGRGLWQRSAIVKGEVSDLFWYRDVVSRRGMGPQPSGGRAAESRFNQLEAGVLELPQIGTDS